MSDIVVADPSIYKNVYKPYGDTGEADMDAPGMDANMRPASMPPYSTSARHGNSPKANLDFGDKAHDANESLRLLGAGQPYGNQ